MKLFNKSDFTISSQGISLIENIPVGGMKQSILIQSEKPGSPVLLFIHGGPSMPVPGVSNRGADYALVMTSQELIKHFTVVFWDQRGTGKSYSPDVPKETMHLKQFMNDAKDVTDYLRHRFKQDKIHLAAHSWGSVIGLYLVSKYPEKYLSYTGFSQITNWVENDKLSYKWLVERARETNNKRALAELASVGEPPYTKGFQQWSVIRKWQFKYNSMFYNAGDKKSATFFSCLKIMLRSPDYSLVDVYNSLVRGFKLSYTEELIHDLNTFDFFTEVLVLNVPVMFIHGRKEKHVMAELINRYFEMLHAPKGKTLYWSEKSSHAFHQDDARENEQRLIQYLKSFISY
ncbi:MAG: alpha/beta fold hydrolase [Ectobacillus sp.]